MISLTALSGLRSAEVRFTTAAARVVSAPVQPVSAVPSAAGEDAFSFQNDVPATENPSVSAEGAVNLSPAAYVASDVSFVTETVAMTEAAAAYKANLNVLKTWDEMSSIIEEI